MKLIGIDGEYVRSGHLKLARSEADLANLEAYARADKAKRDAEALNSKLRQAIADLHFVMAGGDACKVCAVKCAFGEGNCKPVWRGEDGADL